MTSSTESISLLATISWQTPSLKYPDFLNLSKTLKEGEKLKNLPHYIISSELKEFFQFWLKEGIKKSKREWDWCQRNNVSLVYPGHENFPEAFYEIENPPLILTYEGEPCWKHSRNLSIVGSRKPSEESLRWLDEYFTEILKKRSILTISGAAHGIDQKIHAISLRFQRPTVAFLPSGLSSIYPPRFKNWKEPILSQKGALISSFSPFERTYRSSFHKRNYLIAAFSPLLFVVEAGRRSGSMVTASMALEQGKAICTLPFSPMMAKGQGSLDLISDGAFLLRDERDLLLLLDRYLPLLKSSSSVPPPPPPPSYPSYSHSPPSHS